MGGEISFGGVQMGLSPDASGRPDPQTPFRILVLGDFSGRGNRGETESGAAVANRRPTAVDRDNLEQVLARLEPRLENTIEDSAGQPVSVSFTELDHFHPDHLYDEIGLFARLRQLRRKLKKSSTFEEAAAEVRSWAEAPQADDEPPGAPASESAEPPEEPAGHSIEGLFEQTLQATPGEGAAGPDKWSAMIHDLVASYAVEGPNPEQDKLVACVDQVTGRTLARLLHHRDFQALESAWRGLDLLTRRLETDSSLKIFLVDISKAELAADLAEAEDLSQTGLYKLLVEKTVGTPGAQPWAVLCGHYQFSDGEGDVNLLGRLSKIAAAAGAPWVTSVAGRVVGCNDPAARPEAEDWSQPAAEPWSAIQGLTEAQYLAAVWPRFLLRLPYGVRTNPIEQFEFEEMAEGPVHENYLWGNPALLQAVLLGQSFARSGWGLRPGELTDVGDLPIHVYHDDDGEAVARPCGEVLITEPGAKKIAARGVTPLLSVANQDVVRIPAMRSVAGETLAGRW